MKAGDVVLTKGGNLFQIVALPIAPNEFSAIQYVDSPYGSLENLDDLNIEDSSGTFTAKALFASQRLLHQRLNDMEKV